LKPTFLGHERIGSMSLRSVRGGKNRLRGGKELG